MLPTLLTLLAVGAIILAVTGVVFVLGLRTKSPLVLVPVVAFSRWVVNPRQLQRAGRPGAYASIIRHLGRQTGRAYETPVGVVADGDAFLIVLPYGRGTQWLRNVLAAGEATLMTEGATYRVDRPEVIPTRAVAGRLSRADQRAVRLFGTTDCLRLHRAGAVETAA
jgi:deazaflavin-dependent oxidoreductase (nitroreductase family)